MEKALDFLLIALCVNLFGTKMAVAAGAHHKIGRQGDGTKQFVGVVALLIEKYKDSMYPGATLNSVGSSCPELSVLAMLSDSTKPAPGVAQIGFTESIKAGLIARTSQIRGYTLHFLG